MRSFFHPPGFNSDTMQQFIDQTINFNTTQPKVATAYRVEQLGHLRAGTQIDISKQLLP
jgi:hypothetical protein